MNNNNSKKVHTKLTLNLSKANVMPIVYLDNNHYGDTFMNFGNAPIDVATNKQTRQPRQ